MKAPRALGGYFRNAADHRDFTAIGTAAGVATAFAAPIGALVLVWRHAASAVPCCRLRSHNLLPANPLEPD